MNRNRAKRFAYIEVNAADAAAPKPRKGLRERIKEMWTGKEINYVDVELDGSFHCRLSPKGEDNWTRVILDEHSHTVTLKHPKLKPNYPVIAIPAGYNGYYYSANEANAFRLEQVGTEPPIPHVDFRNSPVTQRIIDRIVSGLNGGNLYEILQSRQAWSMWLECWEGGAQLGFFSAEESEPVPYIDLMYKDFCCGSPNEYDALCTADAIAMEHYVMEQVKARLHKEYAIEIFYDRQFYGARYNVDVLGSPTTWELRDDFVEDWQPYGTYYRALHEYDVFRCVMEFHEKGITFRFEGYGNERKQLPADRTTYYAGQAYGAKHRYTRLTAEESEELEDLLIRHIEDACKLISISPIPGSPHCYHINDDRKLHYQGQEPYWAD